MVSIRGTFHIGKAALSWPLNGTMRLFLQHGELRVSLKTYHKRITEPAADMKTGCGERPTLLNSRRERKMAMFGRHRWQETVSNYVRACDRRHVDGIR